MRCRPDMDKLEGAPPLMAVRPGRTGHVVLVLWQMEPRAVVATAICIAGLLGGLAIGHEHLRGVLRRGHDVQEADQFAAEVDDHVRDALQDRRGLACDDTPGIGCAASPQNGHGRHNAPLKGRFRPRVCGESQMREVLLQMHIDSFRNLPDTVETFRDLPQPNTFLMRSQ